MEEAKMLPPQKWGKRIVCHIVSIDGCDHKNCPKCNEYKVLDCFGKRPGCKIGYKTNCRECESEYHRNNEDLKESQKRYVQKNKEKIKKRRKQYLEKNKEAIRLKRKIHREQNREELNKKAKERYYKNREKRKQKSREWYIKNREICIIAQKQHYEENKEAALVWGSEYAKKNREKINARNRERRKDPKVKILKNLSGRLRLAVKRMGTSKADKTIDVIGCSTAELKSRLESLWLPGMTWENYGQYKRGGPMKWHIDHIKPCAAFDLTDPEQQRECFHYTNMQPLWAVDNIIKGDNY
jgi:hypothetical protein